MIRVVIFFLIVALLAFGVVWFADRPGEVAITWQGWRIETSVMAAAVALLAVVALAIFIWSSLRAIRRSPDALSAYLRARRGVRGYTAVSQGLIAIGSGDARAARRYADEAQRIAPAEPLTLLLAAQAAQLAGDRAAAERIFLVMSGREDTKLLGLHGLFIEAQRRSDLPAARLFAEEAAQAERAPAWAGHAVLEFRCVAGDWAGALERLDSNMKSGLIDRVSYRRQRAVLQTARALAAEEGDRAAARKFALDAVKVAPTLVPAAALAGRLLGEAGDLRRAARVVETAWKANPHPDLAETYAHLRPGNSARERLTRIEALAAKTPGNAEAALAVARAALDAREMAIARRSLTPLLAAPTRRAATLMAELEGLEYGDEGRAREWMARAVHARRDPAWTADGFVSERWAPVSPVTGRLDAFQWKDPLAGHEHEGALIEGTEGRAVLAAPPGALQVTESSTVKASEIVADENDERPAPRSRKSIASDPPVREKVLPLVHAPDDPGPEPEPQAEIEAEPPAEPQSDAWRLLRGLFKE